MSNEKALRSELIKLAHAKPELREHLMPLIKGAAETPAPKEVPAPKKAFADRTIGVMGTMAMTKDGSVTFTLTGRGGTIPTLVQIAIRKALLQRKVSVTYDTGTLTLKAESALAAGMGITEDVATV